MLFLCVKSCIRIAIRCTDLIGISVRTSPLPTLCARRVRADAPLIGSLLKSRDCRKRGPLKIQEPTSSTLAPPPGYSDHYFDISRPTKRHALGNRPCWYASALLAVDKYSHRYQMPASGIQSSRWISRPQKVSQKSWLSFVLHPT